MSEKLTLSLDASTKTGWSLFKGRELVDSGYLPTVHVHDFNVNADPNFSPHYPRNIIAAAEEIAVNVIALVERVAPDRIVIENTVRGKNRHTQRLLEYIHFCITKSLGDREYHYMDPSEWRSILEVRLNAADKKNNALVSKGKKRGRITKKHLAVRRVNELYGLGLKLKENDRADSILLGLAFVTKVGGGDASSV